MTPAYNEPDILDLLPPLAFSALPQYRIRIGTVPVYLSEQDLKLFLGTV